jgi:hypothetical protein
MDLRATSQSDRLAFGRLSPGPAGQHPGYGYATGVLSSRKLERANEHPSHDVADMIDLPPDGADVLQPPRAA